jgi:hypothetical protein
MESTQSLVHLVAKLETLVNRFEQALGGPAVPLGSGPVPAQAESATKADPVKNVTAAAPVKKENPIFADFDKEVASKIKPMEDAANVLGGLIPVIVKHIQLLILLLYIDCEIRECHLVPEGCHCNNACMQKI